MRSPLAYCHLKRRSASTKLTLPHAIRIKIALQLADNGAPSFITALRVLLRAVRGRALMKGWKTSGNLEAEKNVQERSHIGSITRFMRPETPSMVLGLAETNSPRPAKDIAPTSATRTRSKNEPCTETPNTSHPNVMTAATSITRN